MLVHSIEEVNYKYHPSSKPLASSVLVHVSHSQQAFKFAAEVTQYTHALLEYKVHNLSLMSDSRQDLQLDPRSIPSILVEPRHSYQFRLAAHYIILWVKFTHFMIYLTCYRHLQLLENDKILLIVDDHGGNILVYLDSQQGINTAVQRIPRKHLHRSKIGETCIFTFDEVRRTLAICETSKVGSSSKFLAIIDLLSLQLQLHIFMFDEQYNQLQSWASGVDLAPWYTPGVLITAMCFVHGSEELLFIGTDLVARVYSLLTQQFRYNFFDYHAHKMV